MTQLRNFCAAAVLTLVFAGATPADDGIIYGGIVPTPTPKIVVRTNDTDEDDTPAAPTPSSGEATAANIAVESVMRVLGEMWFLLY
ncbi:MAG TPA: hypothetical protein VF538_03240 [Pyrinomonadaceae bacterium]|jgi:hypothetical protein